MNDHLKPAFDILSELEKAGLDYWVYGGVGIAGCLGRFVRENKDIDVFVTNENFDRTTKCFEQECHRYGLLPKYEPPKKPGERPKVELIPASDRRDLMSLIPVFIEENNVVFKYKQKRGGDETYPKQILERVERKITEYRFFTPADRFIKEIFKKHMTARPDKRTRPEFITDARTILSPEDLAELDWRI